MCWLVFVELGTQKKCLLAEASKVEGWQRPEVEN